MSVEAAARAWADGWARAWLEHDAEALDPLYAADTVHLSHPVSGTREGGRNRPLSAFVSGRV